MKKAIVINNKTNLRVGRFGSVRPLTTLIFLILCVNLLNAQDFETSLRQAAKDLVNPVYAMIEIPQAEGTIIWTDVKKHELDKISTLDEKYLLMKNEMKVNISASICYKASYNNFSNKVEIQVALEKDCLSKEEFVIVEPAKVEIEVLPAEIETIEELILAKVTSCGRKSRQYAEYETIEEWIEIVPDTLKWVKRRPAHINFCCMSYPDCYTWVLVEVPARYELVTKTVLKTPAKNKVYETPKAFQTITKRKLIKSERLMVSTTLPVVKTIEKKTISANTKVKKIELPIDIISNIKLNEVQILEVRTIDTIKIYRIK